MNARQPTLTVIAGPNGSGKTSVTRVIRDVAWMRGVTYINADDIAQEQFGDWNAPKAVLAAAQLADEQRQRLMAANVDFAYETVFSTERRLDDLRQAKALGYFIRLYFIATDDPDINVMRVAARVAAGGHNVPEDRIRSRYVRSMENAKAALKLVDRAYVIDNSATITGAADVQTGPFMVFRTRDGQIANAYVDSFPAWAQALADSLDTPQPPRNGNSPSP